MAGEARAASAILVLCLLVEIRAHFSPTWAVHIPEGKEIADAVAVEHGFVNLGEIFDHHYHFHHSHVARRSASPEHHALLTGDRRVAWARQQRVLSRKKRDFIPFVQLLSTGPPAAGAPAPVRRDAGGRREPVPRAKARPRSADAKFHLNDPKWPHMWYLNRGGGLDMNVIPAWREGVTGRGVVVTILDDGLETDHPDLVDNYDSAASYDVNSHDSDPQPRYDMIDSNRHGTRCAGEVAATANNSLCAVGVAFGASVGGVRMLDGDVTDAVEARSLSLNPQHVDIYSASWGPDDDGKTVDGPGELATRAFIEGVTKGRGGKGSIFVWASGNGGREHDNCNCDGYTNAIWTLSISSATERGEVPWYSEMCSSTLAATYSSGAINEKQVITTDLHHSCTAGHTGTSASAPLAAGICALALQANRDLTWRDMQHIVVRTARPERLSAGGEWRANGVGRNVSHSFGYGLLDAAGMVRLARGWRPVPAQRKCELAAPRPQKNVPPRATVTLQLDVHSCPGVNFLEHVQARVSLSASRRGDLRIALVSPAGTRVTLLAPRPHDSSRAGFNSWPFMSVHMWGESPIGVWQLEVYNEGRYMGRATLQEWSLVFHGTTTPAAKNDPIPFRSPTNRSKVNATRPVVVQAGRKSGRGKTLPVVPTYTVGLVKRKKNKNSKNPNRNLKRIKPTRSPLENVTRVTPSEFREVSDVRGRKMSSLFEQYPKIQRIYPAPLRATAGPLSEWEMVFYGTESAPDEAASAAPTPETPEEIRENAIEDDMGLVWHDSHTLRDDGLSQPAPRPAGAGAGAGAGCAAASPTTLHCLECAKGLHLYAGRCHTHCPEGTFASEILTQRSSRRRNITIFTEGSAVKREALEAADMEAGTTSPLICLPCHYTCTSCSGPEGYHCSSCPPDARLVNSTDVELKLFCYPASVLPQIDSANWHYRLNVALSLVVFVAAAVATYCLFAVMMRKFGICFCCSGNYDSNLQMAYQKLADDDKQQTAIEVEDEINKALHESSDDDSEEDLDL